MTRLPSSGHICVNGMEQTWDKRLGLETCGRDEEKADQYRHPYEPTPYSVLDRLVDSGLIGCEDVVLDYGCGKGRVEFFLASHTKARTIGIEYDQRIYDVAIQNQSSAAKNLATEFILTRAEAYKVPAEVNCCYFFNPFSVEILRKVMARVLESYYESPREIFLLFYYPDDAYMAYLMTLEELEFYDEIECDDLFPGKDPRERIMIFQLPG